MVVSGLWELRLGHGGDDYEDYNDRVVRIRTGQSVPMPSAYSMEMTVKVWHHGIDSRCLLGCMEGNVVCMYQRSASLLDASVCSGSDLFHCIFLVPCCWTTSMWLNV